MDGAGAQDSASAAKNESWWWVVADLFGEFIPESVWLLAMGAVVLLMVGAFFTVVFDSVDRTPLQTLGLR
ncbi:MAG: hypothetical protein ACM3SW_10480 [Actinomycetota bacterium]